MVKTAGKKKKFGLFKSKKKAASTPPKHPSSILSTPTTVEIGDDLHNISVDHVVSIIPVGQASPPRKAAPSKKTEEEFQGTARSLLAELDLADTDAGLEEAAEGTELILPAPEYEVPEETEKKEEPVTEEKPAVKEEEPVVKEEEPVVKEDPPTEDAELNKSTETEEAPTEEAEEKPAEEETTGETPVVDGEEPAATEGEEKPKEQEAVVEEEKKEDDAEAETTPEEGAKEEETVDPQNTSMIVEDEEPTVAPAPADQQVTENPAKAAVNKILTAAFACAGEDMDKCAETIGTTLSKNPYFGKQFETHFGSHFGIREEVDLDSMFDEKSGSEFLHELANVGYTLIYHISVDEDSWVGRTVNLVFRPGVCNSETIVQPAIEWNTMVGGKSNSVDTKSLKLLDIDGIAPSNVREGEDKQKIAPKSMPIPAMPPTKDEKDANRLMCNLSFPPVGGEDEFDCFFTVTSSDGEIHLFEALNSTDCHKIVAGIKYNAQRLSCLLIEGNENDLMSDFYNRTSTEPDDTSLTNSDVMYRLSHAFFDGQ